MTNNVSQHLHLCSRVAQSVERWSYEPDVGGSIRRVYLLQKHLLLTLQP